MKRICLYIILVIEFLLSINDSFAQISGCTDPLAINYNPSAIINDGSCIYNTASITPTSSIDLTSNLSETSGLISWNNQIWTLNDNTDINLYALDTTNGNIIKSYPLTGTLNRDWEEISQDDGYIYVGDFGNNQNGNRTDLKILRINKNSILTSPAKIDTINFSYSDQKDFNPTGSNNTDFDCEAFIVSSDSIFLFSKQWLSNKTSVYSLPKIPGTFIANLKSSYDVKGLITGAVYLESQKLIALSGYSNLLEPFIYLLYDFSSSDYFGGNKRKIIVSLPFHQVEGIATADGLKYYISNESFTLTPYIDTPQKLHILNLNPFLEKYKEYLSANIIKTESEGDYEIYPVPAGNFINVKRASNLPQDDYSIINYLGKTVLTGKLPESENCIDISSLPCGLYFMRFGEKKIHSYRVIKR